MTPLTGDTEQRRDELRPGPHTTPRIPPLQRPSYGLRCQSSTIYAVNDLRLGLQRLLARGYSRDLTQHEFPVSVPLHPDVCCAGVLIERLIFEQPFRGG